MQHAHFSLSLVTRGLFVFFLHHLVVVMQVYVKNEVQFVNLRLKTVFAFHPTNDLVVKILSSIVSFHSFSFNLKIGECWNDNWIRSHPSQWHSGAPDFVITKFTPMHFHFLVSSKTEAFQVQPEVCFVQNGVCRHVPVWVCPTFL